jgi:hypothetical protein
MTDRTGEHLVNPDIPSMRPKRTKEENQRIIRDHYYKQSQSTRGPMNGSGFTMSSGPGIPGMDAASNEWTLEGAIDPINRRNRHDPARAQPNSFVNGAEGYQYVLPKSATEEHNSVGLIQKARESYASYLTMLQPRAVPVRSGDV